MPDKTDKLLLSLLRQALWGTEDNCDGSGVEWNSAYDLASQHGVLAVTWDAVTKLGLQTAMPLETKISWAYNTQQTEANFRRQVAVIEKLARLYSRHGIEMTLLKGYGLSLYWPVPCHRPCGDVDIWLAGRYKEGDALVKTEWGVGIDYSHHHHTVFIVDGVMVENHYDFVNVHAHGSSRTMERELRRMAASGSERISVGDEYVSLPSPTMTVMFMLRHAASHFAADRILLRHLIDWTVFIDRRADEIDWKEIGRVAAEVGMSRFMHCINAVSVHCLGLDERKIPEPAVEAGLVARVAADIMHPEFSETRPQVGFVRTIAFKIKRWQRNRWKQKLVYDENTLVAFVRSVWSHLLKPGSITG